MDTLPKIWLKRPNLQVVDYLPWLTKWFTSPWFHWLYKAGISCWLWEARHLKQALQSTLRTWLMQQCKAWCIPWLRYMHSHPWTLDIPITVCCKHAVIGWSKFRWPTNPICLEVCKLQSISTRTSDEADLNHGMYILWESALPIYRAGYSVCWTQDKW